MSCNKFKINDPTARELYKMASRSVKLRYGKLLSIYDAEECVLDITRAIVRMQEYDEKVRHKIAHPLTCLTNPYTDLSLLPISANVLIAVFEDLYLAKLADAVALFKLDVTYSSRFVSSVQYAQQEYADRCKTLTPIL